jgi:hypothetical protein
MHLRVIKDYITLEFEPKPLKMGYKEDRFQNGRVSLVMLKRFGDTVQNHSESANILRPSNTYVHV